MANAFRPQDMTTEETTIDDPQKKAVANAYLKEAAMVLKPGYTKWVGSVTLHVYRDEFAAEQKISFGYQPTGIDFGEDIAIGGLTFMRDQMMLTYGQRPPRKVKR